MVTKSSPSPMRPAAMYIEKVNYTSLCNHRITTCDGKIRLCRCPSRALHQYRALLQFRLRFQTVLVVSKGTIYSGKSKSLQNVTGSFIYG